MHRIVKNVSIFMIITVYKNDLNYLISIKVIFLKRN